MVYLPEGDEMAVGLSAAGGTFAVEWITRIEGKIIPGGTVQGGSKPNFAVPFPGPAVLLVNKA